jgi:putative ABC transport system substrate-binding protein
MLWGGSLTEEMMKAFRLGLRDLGYAEGRDLVIERRSANGSYELLPQLAAELVRTNVRAIVVDGTPATQAAKHATATIPIIMVMVSDPVGAGLVSNIAHPGGNITGLSLMTTDLSAKRLQLLKETVPGLVRIAVLWNPDTAFHQNVVEEFRLASPSLSIELTFMRARTLEDFKPAFSLAQRARAQVLYVIDDGFFFANRATLLKLASKARLPLVYAAREMTNSGALMFYGADFVDLTRRSAGYVDKILKGANPADLPIEQPTKFELVINLKTANTLGIKIPKSVLLSADEVIH